MKKEVIDMIIKANDVDITGITIEYEKVKLTERAATAYAMRAKGKLYREIGEALGIGVERSRQLVKYGEHHVLHYIEDAKRAATKKAAAEKAAEKAAAEKKERLEKVVPGKTETWRALSIYDLDPSVRLFNCLVRWFDRTDITVGMIVDAVEDREAFCPLGLKTRGMGLTTWKELLVSLDQVMKNDEDSSLFKKYYNQ
jgi:hypothetical protein